MRVEFDEYYQELLDRIVTKDDMDEFARRDQRRFRDSCKKLGIPYSRIEGCEEACREAKWQYEEKAAELNDKIRRLETRSRSSHKQEDIKKARAQLAECERQFMEHIEQICHMWFVDYYKHHGNKNKKT